MDAFLLMCPLSLCILRVFALSEYLCTPSERRTRNLVYFPGSLTGCRKTIFDNLKSPFREIFFNLQIHLQQEYRQILLYLFQGLLQAMFSYKQK